MRFDRFASLLGALALASATACSGGGSAQSPGTLPASTAAPQAMSRVTLTVPAATAAAHSDRRSPDFIVTQTASLEIYAQAASAAPPTSTPAGAVTANISATAPGCAAVTGGITCTVSFPAPAGADVFYVYTFDGANGTGNVLASATVNATVSVSTTNTVPITLNGAVASLTASATPANQCPVRGTPATLTGSISALDADGNTIVGSYANPFTITDTSMTGHYTVNTPSIASSATAPSVAYDGAAAPANNNDVGVFTAVIPGVSTQTPQQLVVTPVTASGTHLVYVLDSGNDVLQAYDICGGPNTSVALPAGTGGTDIALNSTRTIAYIAGNNNEITIVNLTSGAVAQTAMPTGYTSNGIAISSDDSTVYVAYSNSTIQRMTTSNNTLITSWPISGSRIAPWNDGTHPARLFVSGKTGNVVRVVDPTSGSVLSTLSTGANSAPYGISVSPDNTRVAVMDTGTASVTIIDPVAAAITATIAVGNKPGPHGWLSSDALLVANQQDQTVSVISAANTVTKTFTGFPAGMSALINSEFTNTFFIAATNSSPQIDEVQQYDRYSGNLLHSQNLPAGAGAKALRQSF